MRTMTNQSTNATMARDEEVVQSSSDKRVKSVNAISGRSTPSKSKHTFRFPRFSLKSPATSTLSAAAETSPRMGAPPRSPTSNSKRLRNFARLRKRHSSQIGTSETTAVTSAMTALTTDHQAGVTDDCPTSNSSSTSTNANRTAHHQQQQQQQEEEAREDYIKVVPIRKNASSVSPQRRQELDGTQQVAAVPSSDEIHDHLDLVPLNRQDQLQKQEEPYACSTVVFQVSCMDMVCGRSHGQKQLMEQELQSPSQRPIPDDPTVQDSIECIFSSQLQAGLDLWSESDEEKNERIPSSQRSIYSYEETPINAPSEAELPSPAPLMQSRQKSRTPLPVMSQSLMPSKRRQHLNSQLHAASNDGKPHQNHNSPRHHNLRFPSDDDNSSSSEVYDLQKLRQATSKRSKQADRQTTKVVHIGTFDPRTNRIVDVAETDHNLMEEDPMVRVAVCSKAASPACPGTLCHCHTQSAPILPPEYWPQAPLLFRPTPGSGISILGIRQSSQTQHFWKPSDGGWWLTPLYEMAGKEAPSFPPNVPSMCAQCCILPINNGNEPVGEALVVDFETPLFEGELLLRLRHVDGGATAIKDPRLFDYDDNQGYFTGLNRRYQVVVRGKFKYEVPFTELVSGFEMDRPYGKLPAKWIMKGAVKVLSFFAPQLEVQMDGPRPKTMAPLGSTPQVLIVQDVGPNDAPLPPLDATVEEPTEAKSSILNTAYPGTSSLQRARGRKKTFDKLYATNSKHPVTKVSSGSHETYYTFEFLQHLVNFEEFSIELGNLIGSIPLDPILAGHPLPITAMMKDGKHKVWSFDIWHENLVQNAKDYDTANQAKCSGVSTM